MAKSLQFSFFIHKVARYARVYNFHNVYIFTKRYFIYSLQNPISAASTTHIGLFWAIPKVYENRLVRMRTKTNLITHRFVVFESSYGKIKSCNIAIALPICVSNPLFCLHHSWIPSSGNVLTCCNVLPLLRSKAWTANVQRQQTIIEFTRHDHSISASWRHIYMWCCSSCTFRLWWTAHSVQHQRRGCNTTYNIHLTCITG